MPIKTDEHGLPLDARAPLGLAPQNFLFEDLDDDTRPIVQPLVAAYETAVLTVGKAFDVRDAALANPALNDSAKVLVVEQYNQKQLPVVLKLMQNAHDVLQKQIAHLEGEMTAPLESTATSSIAREIRDHVKGKKPAEVRKILLHAIEHQDRETVGALLGVKQGYLVGLSDIEVQEMTRRWREKTTPKSAKRLAIAQRAFDLHGQRANLIHGALAKARGADANTARNVTAAAARMEKALAR